MEVSPFPYQGPLEPDQVQGRDALLADVTERLSEHRVTALLGPRRFGKTSLLRRVGADLEAAGVSVIWVDLYEVTSLVDVAVRFDEAIGAARGPVSGPASRIAAGLDVNLGVLKLRFAARRDRPDASTTLHVLLEVLVRAAAETATVVVLDEFSSIARVDGAAGLLRTKLQPHYQQLGIVFAGSEPSMMRTLFSNRAQPFYAQADLVEVGPLEPAAVEAIVADGFARTGRDPGGLAARIADFTLGHPQRAMQLADAAWRASVRGSAYTPGVWDDAIAEVRAATAAGNERLYSGFESGEKDVLRILASGGSIFGRAADLLALANGTAQNARRRLVDAGDLVEDASTYRLVDPVFADWLRHRFPI